jgi:hypothetical protein
MRGMCNTLQDCLLIKDTKKSRESAVQDDAEGKGRGQQGRARTTKGCSMENEGRRGQGLHKTRTIGERNGAVT